MKPLVKKNISRAVALIVRNALAEDVGCGDITGEALFDKSLNVCADIICKEEYAVLYGIEVIEEVFRQLDKNIKVFPRAGDGDIIKKGQIVCSISGPAPALLIGERTALNFLGRLSGIATRTSRFVKKIKGLKVKILDTRKTTPGLRVLEKSAVKAAGGSNHRFGLFDQVLIKDNHIDILRHLSGADYTPCAIVNKARNKLKKKTIIEIEVRDKEELVSALKGNPDIIMLDNMNIEAMKKAVKLKNLYNKKIKLEASGNINEKNIRNVALCGVDFISVGSLTHSINTVDFSLKVTKY